MLYLKCPTCKNLLGNKEIPFEEEKARICESRLSQAEKEVALSKLPTMLGLDRYCCRMRLITFTNHIDLLK